MKNPAIPTPKFKKLEQVRLKGDPSQWGPVWQDPVYSGTVWMYKIFLSAKNQQFIPEDELLPFVIEGPVAGDLDDLLKNLLLFKMNKPLSDTLYSLHASRTKFEVYQFRPALKFLGNQDQRLLIADEVGLGKTIEAGIIFLELQARLTDIARVLVVCPSGLRAKWQDEFQSRFDETFNILDADGLRRFLEDYHRFGEAARLRGIVSLELIRREEFAAVLGKDLVHFDLVIIDEAHHCRNTETLANAVASVLSDNADSMLLLTATPLQLGIQDLFHLLTILAPGDFDSLEGFELTLEPNRHINRATQLLAAGKAKEALAELVQVESRSMSSRFLNNPFYQEVKSRLQKTEPSFDDRAISEKYLLDLNTLAHVFTRARKRDVQEQPPIRHAIALKVAFTAQERRFYNAVIDYVRYQFTFANRSGWASGFAVIMRERQAASCISAVKKYFSELLEGSYKESKEDEYVSQGVVEDDDPPTNTVDSASALQQLVKTAKLLGHSDTKYEVFLSALRHVLAEDPKTKILVFSFFRGTLEYLNEHLREQNLGVRMIHGGVAVGDRQKIVEEFRDNPTVNILLSSEVGAEGLDFQFCNTLFNYDLPWNPMRVEQRIGRIDRFGQLSPVVRIYNLVIENSIEDRIFYRLYERINIFKESIGDIEAILGEEIRSISKRIFGSRLTPKEETELAERAAIVIIKKKRELEEFESQRLQFMGQDAIFSERIEQAIESGHYVSEAEIRSLIKTFLAERFPRSRLERNGETDSSYSFLPDSDLVEHIRTLTIGSQGSDQTSLDFVRRLKPYKLMPLTFSADLAYERKLLEFLTLRHPVARAAIKFWKEQPAPEMPVVSLVLASAPEWAGDYFFFVFAFQAAGLRDDTTMTSVAISLSSGEIIPELGERMLRLFQTGDASMSESRIEIDPMSFDSAKQVATQFAAEEVERRKIELGRLNAALVSAREAAIEQAYEIKRRKVSGYIRNSSNPNIRRMRQGQLERIEANHTKALEDLKGKKRIKMTFSVVLGGAVRLIKQNK